MPSSYMRFSFIQKTNSNDVTYETKRTESLVRRILGDPNIFEFQFLEEIPDYDSATGWAKGRAES